MGEFEPVSTFPQLLAQVVAARGDAEAVLTPDESLTYRDLDARIAKMAMALLGAGAGKGTRVGLLLPDGVLWLTSFCACLRIGALVTPMSTMATPKELAYVLRNSDAQLLIAARRYLRHDYVAKLEEALPELAETEADRMQLLGAPYLRSIWLDGATGVSWARPIEDLLALANDDQALRPGLLAEIEKEVVPSDDAFVVYTSGSTAQPKAVLHGHKALAQQPRIHAANASYSGHERLLSTMPAFWMGGINAAFLALSTGGTLIYPASHEPHAVLDAIEKFGVTIVKVWHMRSKYTDAAAARGIDVDHIKGLGPPRDDTGKIIPPHLVPNSLGMTESFAQHSDELWFTPLPEEKAGASGRPVNGIERRVVNPDTGEEVAMGEVGELQLRGGSLMTGFYKVLRQDLFTADGFYPTKDLVRIDADGYLYFVGRTKDMIKVKGANVSRLEVEAALQSLPEVALALVAGLPDPELGEVLAAAVAPVAGTTPTEEGLKASLRGLLSSYKIPDRIVLISPSDIPRTSTGKVKLFDLGELIAGRCEGGQLSAAKR